MDLISSQKVTTLHSLRKLFKSREEKVLCPPKPTLPIELLEHIVSFVQARKELLMLSYASSILNSIANKQLYKRVTISPDTDHANKRSFALLCTSMSNPRLAALVTTLRLRVKDISKCEQAQDSLGRRRPCVCAEWDRLFGTVIMNIPNLRDLDIELYMRNTKITNWPSYLASLATTQLQRFRFRCHYTNCSDVPNFGQLFTRPCMRTLEALNVPSQLLSPTEQDAAGLSDPDVLSSLTTLCDDGHSTMPNFYIHRNIRRVFLSTSLYERPFQRMRSSQIKLTHLSTTFSDRTILNIIINDSDMVAQLCHLGIFPLDDGSNDPTPKQIHEILPILSRLSNLSSIQIHMPLGLGLQLGSLYFSHFREMLPTLSQILHRGTLWRRCKNGEWKQSEVHLTPWDVINLGLDSI